MADYNNPDPITAGIGDPQLDTPQTDAAIDDIVAEEADKILAAEDATAAAEANLETAPDEPGGRGHPIFWFMIALLAVVAVIAAVVLLSPGLALPFAP